MKLIREEIESVEFLVEQKNGKKSMYIEGVFLLKGTRKYNKDAFIVIKNRSRDPFVPSQAPVDKTEDA